MFNLFTSFVDKFVSLMAGIAISVGLVYAPTPEIPVPIDEVMKYLT